MFRSIMLDLFSTGNYSWLLRRPMPKWHTALGNVQSGTSNALCMCLGDSTTAGYTTSYTNAKVGSYPRVLASLRGMGWGGFICNSNVGANGSTLPAYDPRVSYGAGWNEATGALFGGKSINNGAGTTALQFAPGVTFDRIVVYTAQAAFAGSCTVDIGGASLATINSFNASFGVLKTVINCTRGINTVNIKASSVADAVYLVGIDCYDSQTVEARVLGVGAAGWAVADYNDGTWAAPAFAAIAPDLTIIRLTANDCFGAGTNPATYETILTAIVTNAKLTGDVILVTGAPMDPSWGSQAVQDGINAKVRAVALASGSSLLEIPNLYNYGVGNANGFYSDTVHGTAVGYTQDAKAAALAICA